MTTPRLAPNLSSWTVLVADGSEGGRRLAGETLARIGIRRLRTARDGAEALTALAEHGPDLVLLDWDLQVVPAREVAAMARTARPEADRAPAIVAVLSEPTRSVVEAAVAAGVDAILARPYSPRLLRERLEHARAA